MTRKKKARSGGMIGVAKSDRPKRETNTQAQEARKQKRLKQRKGLTSGSRTQEATKKQNKGGGKKLPQDSRLGSKTPIQLVMEPAAVQQSPATPKPVKKPQVAAAGMTVKVQPVLSFEQELDQIENDGRLNRLLECLDNDELLSQADQAYVDERVERHQFLLAELGYDEDDDFDDFDDFDDEPDEAMMAQLDEQFVESQSENLSEEELYERFLQSEKALKGKEDK